MQSGRLWGTEIAGLAERESSLGRTRLVAGFQKTNVPLAVGRPTDLPATVSIADMHDERVTGE